LLLAIALLRVLHFQCPALTSRRRCAKITGSKNTE
jgi:hypothetical protein